MDNNYSSQRQHFFEHDLQQVIVSKYDNPLYLSALERFLHTLNGRNGSTAALILADCVAHASFGLVEDHSEKAFKNYLDAFKGCCLETVKRRQFHRWSEVSDLSALNFEVERDSTTSHEIADYAKTLLNDGGIHFLGELAGAWMLTCPIEIIRATLEFSPYINWVKTDDDYIFILYKSVILNGIEMFRP
jgi:hypothetical protein